MARRAALAQPASVGLSPTPFQAQVLATPEDFDLFLGGGRGGAKSWALAWLAMRFAEQYGDRGRSLYLRQTYNGASDFETSTRILFAEVYGDAARYNASSRIWRFPSGGTLEIGQLEDLSDWRKYQGRSFGLILIDEAGQWPTLDVIEGLLRSCLRAPRGVPVRMVLAANPGDSGHAELARRFVLGREPWAPFLDAKSARTWVYCPSTYRDNEHLDGAAYLRQLEAATAADPELRKAWIDGSWAIARGAYFASVLDEHRVAFGPWTPEEWVAWHRDSRRVRGGPQAELYLAHDFGSSAPSATYACWRSDGRVGPDGRFYPPGSILLLDELATNEPDSLTRGLGWTVPKLAEAIREFCEPWGCPPRGVADDAIFAKSRGQDADSISDEFRAAGVSFRPAHKADRRTGWEVMRRLLSDAGKPDVPGLYVSRRCAYWWQTVPALPRDPRKPDDVDSRAADHAADACRYAVVGGQPTAACFSTLGVIGS
ncbi:MAG: hypothetical protein F9K18_01125 [Thermoanaerobaculia bacterium]|nr:MAG: hypothetical protein F9K18_01125 [Thermoanaerobaculia bacterium]